MLWQAVSEETPSRWAHSASLLGFTGGGGLTRRRLRCTLHELVPRKSACSSNFAGKFPRR